MVWAVQGRCASWIALLDCLWKAHEVRLAVQEPTPRVLQRCLEATQQRRQQQQQPPASPSAAAGGQLRFLDLVRCLRQRTSDAEAALCVQVGSLRLMEQAPLTA